MSIISLEEVKELIKVNSAIVDFGSSEDSVDSIWFEKAEKTLGIKLPESYLAQLVIQADQTVY